jgi:cellulose synthase/poly-beta-1,6-N-acetylglucosamine synthase-like glycosyltransferase
VRVAAAGAAVLGAIWVWPQAVVLLALALMLSVLVLSSALRLAAAIAALRAPRPAPDPPDAGPLPVVSILVPMFGEPDIAPRLVQRLGALDYPRAALDVLLVIEECDRVTRAALADCRLPGWMRVIVVPDGQPRTKPRALNYALAFARGPIVGVYDAEDAPDAGQIRAMVGAFARAGPDLACVQGVLDYYNPTSNWLSRCFTIEYAAWFRLVLPGFARLGLVVPLGGTTLFFRRAALEALGGWDAHNVTEDADLGVRLARHGFRTALISSVTLEEANCRVLPWIKQRSRWLKGYAMTYGVHMRDPRLLWRQLGAWRFFGLQVQFLGTLVQFLFAPIFWSLWLLALGLDWAPADGVAPGLGGGVLGILMGAEVVAVAINLLALRDPRHRGLWPWALTLNFYFPLATLAAWKAAWEVLRKPFYWDKTQHGLDDSGHQTVLRLT